MNISEPFVRRPVATALLMAAVAFVGLASFPYLPVAPLPQVDFPTIQVSASLAGASPETMASSVAAPLERQFGQIAGVTQMTSQSTLGATTIVLQFDLGRSIDSAAQDVQAAITAAGKQLPQTLSTPPTYRKVNPADSPDSHPGRAVRLAAADHRRRLCGQRPRPANLAGFRRRAGEHRRRAEAGDPRPGRPRQARRQRIVAGGRPRLAGHRHHQRRQGHPQRRQDELHDRHQRSTHATRAIRRRHHRLSQRGGDAGARRRPRRRGRYRQHGGRLCEQPAQHPAPGIQAAGRQCHRHRRPDQGAAAPAHRHHSAGHQGRHHPRSHRDHPRIRRATWSSRSGSPSRWWSW